MWASIYNARKRNLHQQDAIKKIDFIEQTNKQMSKELEKAKNTKKNEPEKNAVDPTDKPKAILN